MDSARADVAQRCCLSPTLPRLYTLTAMARRVNATAVDLEDTRTARQGF